MRPGTHADDHRQLAAYLARLEDNGQRVPCRDPRADVRDLWTSDEPARQAQAAVRCVGCPALKACDAYGLVHPREAGVYGGRTERDRQDAAKEASA